MFDYASLVREYKCPVKLYWKASWSQDVRHLLISILLFGKEIRLICCNLFLTSHLPSSSLIKQIPALDHCCSTDFERRTYFLDVQQPLSCLSLHIWCLQGTDTWVYSMFPLLVDYWTWEPSVTVLALGTADFIGTTVICVHAEVRQKKALRHLHKSPPGECWAYFDHGQGPDLMHIEHSETHPTVQDTAEKNSNVEMQFTDESWLNFSSLRHISSVLSLQKCKL